MQGTQGEALRRARSQKEVGKGEEIHRLCICAQLCSKVHSYAAIRTAMQQYAQLRDGMRQSATCKRAAVSVYSGDMAMTTERSDESAMLTMTQVAAMIGVHRTTLLRWVERNEFAVEFDLVGGRKRWRRSLVERYVAGHPVDAA